MFFKFNVILIRFLADAGFKRIPGLHYHQNVSDQAGYFQDSPNLTILLFHSGRQQTFGFIVHCHCLSRCFAQQNGIREGNQEKLPISGSSSWFCHLYPLKFFIHLQFFFRNNLQLLFIQNIIHNRYDK